MSDESPPVADEPQQSEPVSEPAPPPARVSGYSWGAIAGGAAAGAAAVIVVACLLAVAGVLVVGSSPARAPSPAAQATARVASPVPASSPVVNVADRVPTNLAVAPDLPAAIDLAPPGAPWSSGDTVVVSAPGGANLRPYPVTDDAVAGASVQVPEGAQVQVVSTFRLRMSDGNWWYVRVPAGADDEAPPSFGWVREDLLAPAAP